MTFHLRLSGDGQAKSLHETERGCGALSGVGGRGEGYEEEESVLCEELAGQGWRAVPAGILGWAGPKAVSRKQEQR